MTGHSLDVWMRHYAGTMGARSAMKLVGACSKQASVLTER
jgi:hypothetical protein